MQAIIFIGIQATGKSTFYLQRFFHTHVRINMDMLKTRHRENILMGACLEGKQPFVVDNTNPTIGERKRYIDAARQNRFQVVGYYFQSNVIESIARNSKREERLRIPEVGIRGTSSRLILPRYDEGFDELHYVRTAPDMTFITDRWVDEV